MIVKIGTSVILCTTASIRARATGEGKQVGVEHYMEEYDRTGNWAIA